MYFLQQIKIQQQNSVVSYNGPEWTGWEVVKPVDALDQVIEGWEVTQLEALAVDAEAIANDWDMEAFEAQQRRITDAEWEFAGFPEYQWDGFGSVVNPWFAGFPEADSNQIRDVEAEPSLSEEAYTELREGFEFDMHVPEDMEWEIMEHIVANLETDGLTPEEIAEQAEELFIEEATLRKVEEFNTMSIEERAEILDGDTETLSIGSEINTLSEELWINRDALARAMAQNLWGFGLDENGEPLEEVWDTLRESMRDLATTLQERMEEYREENPDFDPADPDQERAFYEHVVDSMITPGQNREEFIPPARAYNGTGPAPGNLVWGHRNTVGTGNSGLDVSMSDLNLDSAPENGRRVVEAAMQAYESGDTLQWNTAFPDHCTGWVQKIYHSELWADLHSCPQLYSSPVTQETPRGNGDTGFRFGGQYAGNEVIAQIEPWDHIAVEHGPDYGGGRTHSVIALESPNDGILRVVSYPGSGGAPRIDEYDLTGQGRGDARPEKAWRIHRPGWIASETPVA